VIILGPDDELPGGEDHPLEEARILYVAATRARQDLSRLERHGLPELWQPNPSVGVKRWVARNHSYYFIEVGLPGDYESASAANKYIHPEGDLALATQDYIWNNIHGGTEVQIRAEVRNRHHFYRVSHAADGQPGGLDIGQLNRQFFEDVKSALRHYAGLKFRYPLYLKGIRVAAVTTDLVPLHSEVTVEPFRSSHFCLGVRLRGMGYLMQRG
jgi:hypothetical protein